jgi:hypothetical protein
VGWLLCACLLNSSDSYAAEVLKADISNERNIYKLELDMALRASDQRVWHVLTDFVNFYRLNPSIIKSRVLPSEKQDSVRIQTVIHDCILIFCQEIDRVEDVYVAGNGQLVTTVIEELSDIKSGSSTWRLIPTGDTTRVQYRGSIELKQDVPPIIGSYLLRKKLLEGMMISLQNIEKIAQANVQPAKARFPGRMSVAPFKTVE